MPNPRINKGGPCTSCQGFGGMAPGNLGDTLCNWTEKSGKTVCRMPELGCAFWEPAQPKDTAASRAFIDSIQRWAGKRQDS